jgi:hypothetical protein
MEEKVFPKPAVAGKLKEDFIEARLHYDTGPSIEANKKLQKDLAHSTANPVYVIIDPQTGKVVRKKAGLMSAEKFLEFLQGKVKPVDPLDGGGQH